MLSLALVLVATRSVWSTHATQLENPPLKEGCVVDSPHSDTLSLSLCGCRSDYLTSFHLTLDVIRFHQNTIKVNVSVLIIPKKLLIQLWVRSYNLTVTFGGMQLPVQLPDKNLCSESITCPLAANVPTVMTAEYDYMNDGEWSGKTYSGTVNLLDGSFNVLVCVDVKLDLSGW